MAAVGEGEDFLSLVSVEEKDSIPENLRRKLQDVWELKTREITNLKVDVEKLKLNSDNEFAHLRTPSPPSPISSNMLRGLGESH
ncbi:hypothetical protein E2C01_074857 [Portunus trituberculatus]|uniref:Uncharacterized protein n=1 Tax=Portunus trituberculatus TaxID=210409 RepID=A0A5B7I4J3_PORTR|nr:hypothetical protein [Portunus trituberculatus]